MAQGFVCRLTRYCQSYTRDERFFCCFLDSIMLHSFLKLDRKTMSQHRHVISIKLEAVGLNGWALIGGIRLSLQGFNAESPLTIGFAINMLEKEVRHNRRN